MSHEKIRLYEFENVMEKLENTCVEQFRPIPKCFSIENSDKVSMSSVLGKSLIRNGCFCSKVFEYLLLLHMEMMLTHYFTWLFIGRLHYNHQTNNFTNLEN